MTPEEQYFKYAHDYLTQLRFKNKDFVIDGDTNEIGNIDISTLVDMNFGENLSEELVVVHATDYSPASENAILSTESTLKSVNNIAGTHDSHRTTVHTTLNSLVQNNNGGNWDYRLFTILEPFSNIDSKVCGFGVSDTFFANRLNLSDKGIVLVREEDKEKLSEDDKKMNIVYYRGNPRNAVNKAMIMMGYKPQTLEIDNIKNQENDQRIQDYRKEKGFGPSRHSMTVYSLIENRIGMRDIKITSLRGVQTNTVIDNHTDIEEVIEILKGQKISMLSDTMNIVNSLLEMGIAFNESGPYFLNTTQTIERISKYYDHEHYQLLVKDENLSNYPELVELLNQYNNFFKQNIAAKEQERQISESHQEAINTNNLLNSLPQDVTNSDFLNDDYIKQYIASLKSLTPKAPFFVKVTSTGIELSAKDEDKQIFTEDIFPDKVTDEGLNSLGIDNMRIPFDPEKRLIENLKEGSKKVSEIYQILKQLEQKQEETPNSGLHM